MPARVKVGEARAILQLQEQLFLRGEMRGRLGLDGQAHIGIKIFDKAASSWRG